MNTLRTCIALLACCLSAVASLAAEAPAEVKPMKYTHVYADASGVSHFRDEQFDFREQRPGGPTMHALPTGPNAMLLRLHPGEVEDWHNAPKPWFLFVLQGMSEVTVSDGEVRRFGPGSVVLMEDVKGKGHQTRTVGNIDHIAAVVPVSEASTASKP